MAASGFNMNVSACTFTPTGGSAAVIKGVKTLTLSPNSQELSEGADADLINTVAGVVGLDFKVMMETNRQTEFHAVVPGVYGALAYTINDFKNGATASGGGFSVAVANAYYCPGDEVNAHRSLGTQSPHWGTFSTDGTTSPVAYTAL